MLIIQIISEKTILAPKKTPMAPKYWTWCAKMAPKFFFKFRTLRVKLDSLIQHCIHKNYTIQWHVQTLTGSLFVTIRKH